MRNLKKIIIVSAMLAGMSPIQAKAEDYNIICATGEAQITASTAVLKGTAVQDGDEPLSMFFWFVIGTDEATLDTEGTVISAGESYSTWGDSFTAKTDDLEPLTTYYWKAVVSVGETVVEGKVQSFTTPWGHKVRFNVNEPNPGSKNARIGGTVAFSHSYLSPETPTEFNPETEIKIWVLYAPDIQQPTLELLKLVGKKKNVLTHTGLVGDFELPLDIELKSLSAAHSYSYVFCVLVNGAEYHSDIKSFTTKGPNVQKLAEENEKVIR